MPKSVIGHDLELVSSTFHVTTKFPQHQS